MKLGLIVLFIIYLAHGANAQMDSLNRATFRTYEDTLEVLADGMLNEKEEERLYFCEKFIKHLVTTLNIAGSFQYDFENFENISILPSGDDQFRIFTWQLEVAQGEYRYYGAIQLNQKDLQLIPLIDRSFNLENLETISVSNEQWYGAVYYNIMPFVHDNKPAYMLFGYDTHDYYNRKKILDVLTFDDQGNAIFGAPVFYFPNDIVHNRLILTFAATANIRLNFDKKLGMIVFDHLINESDVSSKQMLPDGSYSGFQYKDGRWNFVEKIFDQVLDKPPHEVPLAEEKLKLVKPDPNKKKYR